MVIEQWDTFSGFNIPMTTLRVDQEVTRWLRLRAGYLYQHASGPTSLDGSVLVPLRGTNDSATASYLGAGTTNMTSHTSEAGFTLQLFETFFCEDSFRRRLRLTCLHIEIPDELEKSTSDRGR